MATYDLNQVANALVLEVQKTQMAERWEKHFNPLAQAGLAVGDTVYFDVVVPEWVRSIVISKRTNTANADTLTAQCQDAGPLIAPVLPIKNAGAVQTTGASANNAAGTVLIQCAPIGKTVRVSLLLATSVPAQALLSIAMYDA
jgi:hypothetical protein